MNWNEYKEAVKNDAIERIEDGDYSTKYYDDFDSVWDAMFLDDSITGNGSGSYYFNSYKASEAVSGIIFDEEACNAFREFDYEGIPTEKGAESCDVIARCIVMNESYGEIRDAWEEKYEGEDDE